MARRLSGHADQEIDAPASACVRVLGDVARWPEWFDRIHRVDVLERHADGTPARVAIEASILRFHPRVVATVAVEEGSRVALERLPHGSSDDEALRLTVTVEAGGARALARAEVEAE